jgi:hypothetical protein
MEALLGPGAAEAEPMKMGMPDTVMADEPGARVCVPMITSGGGGGAEEWVRD